MEPIIVNGVSYCTVKDTARAWGVSESTVRKYANEANPKIAGCIRHGRRILIPLDAIPPIEEPVAQGMIWAILEMKNALTDRLDLTKYDVADYQLEAVLRQLRHQLYVRFDDAADTARNRLLSCCVTEKGMELVRYRKKLKGNPDSGESAMDILEILSRFLPIGHLLADVIQA